MICLHEITLALMHKYYQGFANDPDTYMDMSRFTEFRYDADSVEAHCQSKQGATDRKEFLIMKDTEPVGEICLKHIDCGKKECELSIHLQNDAVKNRGYGTQAEKLAVAYAFENLKMAVVRADSVLKNTRSQHVLEKVGFDFLKEAGIFRYYAFTREKYEGRNAD